MAKKKKKYYVVWYGRKKGVYQSWEECNHQILGFPGAKYKSFLSPQEAEYAFKEGPSKYWGVTTTNNSEPRTEIDIIKFGYPIGDSISVDGACQGNPGLAEYQGVHTMTKEILFHNGPFQDGTNNIMEFLALVHAASYCKKNSLDKPIYSDSRIAISWVKQKKCKTNLSRTQKNKELFVLIERAEKWLEVNAITNKILKWETKAWGENPADFGRK